MDEVEGVGNGFRVKTEVIHGFYLFSADCFSKFLVVLLDFGCLHRKLIMEVADH